MSVFEENGDLLTCTADFIVQQCNCLTVNSHGLAQSIAAKFPDADTYALRRAVRNKNLAIAEDRGKPGTISIHKHVINMYAQWRPGPIKSPYFTRYPEYKEEPESAEMRQKWFKRCLQEISLLFPQSLTLAFPFKIGCGLAGGNWTVYKKMLEKFALENPRFKVVIITQLPN